MRRSIAVCTLALVTAVGCGKTEPTTPAAPASGSTSAAKPMHPAAATAMQFLQASAAGDLSKATGLLTPVAVEQLNKQGMTIAPLNVESPKFIMTRFLVTEENEAAVEFAMQFQIEGEQQEFHGCCVMKNIGADWRLAGVIIDPGNGMEPVVQNYEQELSPPTTNPANTVANPAGGQVPQTAQSPDVPQQR
ncbi:hypothetical protein [Aeoliella sp. SH292]|uniref:hypothetical protein n=1 Tax=Aeoliella sp. SH292 TaxID=3454464 RepID=UPI003F99E794